MNREAFTRICPASAAVVKHNLRHPAGKNGGGALWALIRYRRTGIFAMLHLSRVVRSVDQRWAVAQR